MTRRSPQGEADAVMLRALLAGSGRSRRGAARADSRVGPSVHAVARAFREGSREPRRSDADPAPGRGPGAPPEL